jgi:hypothetical protein
MSVAALARRGGDSNLPKTVPGLKLWLDGRRPGSTFADGNSVGTWKDMSGNANDVVQATAAKKPAYRTATTTGYLSLPGVAGNYASSPDSAAVSVTGDIDVRVKCALADWTPAASSGLWAKWGASGHLSIGSYVATSGVIVTFLSSDGTNAVNAISSVGTGITDGATKWIRFTRVAATGVSKYYLSDNGTAWTQLGTDIATTAGNIFDSDAVWAIGAGASGGATPVLGNFYRMQIRSNVLDDGTGIVFDADFTTTGRSFLESSSNHAVVTINGDQARESVSTIPSIIFDGVDDVLQAALALPGSSTIYVVAMESASNATTQGLVSFRDGNAKAHETILVSGNLRAITTDDAAVSVYAERTPPSAGTTFVFDSVRSHGATDTITATLNGSASSPATPVALGALTQAGMYIGNLYNSAAGWGGSIACALVYSGAHDANTRKKIERWLGRQYGVAITQ